MMMCNPANPPKIPHKFIKHQFTSFSDNPDDPEAFAEKIKE